MSARECVDCGHPLRSWRESAEDQPGTRQPRSRGLCSACGQRHWRAGTLVDFPRRRVAWDDIADDYALLRDEGYPAEVIADRLGMSLTTLERALERHRDDPRSRKPRQRRAS